jgi:hypothetical protein
MLETKRWIQGIYGSPKHSSIVPTPTNPSKSGIYGIFRLLKEDKKTVFSSDRLKQTNI